MELVDISQSLTHPLYQSGFLQKTDGTPSWDSEFNKGTIYRGVNGVQGIYKGFWSIQELAETGILYLPCLRSL